MSTEGASATLDSMEKWDQEAEQRRFVESSWTGQRGQSPQQHPPKPPRSSGRMIGIGIVAALAIGSLLTLALVLRHSRRPTAVAAIPAVPTVTATPAPVVSASSSVDDQAKIVAEGVMNAPNAVEAAKLCQLQNDYNEISGKTMLFARWAMDKMTWAEVSSRDNTTFGRIMKEPDGERGKHACWKGSVIEIHSMKSDTGQTYFIGGIMVPESQPIRFVAVRSSGDIVAQSTARVCGTVVGTFNYDNVSGGQTQAIQVVGMFDLPENHSIGSDHSAPPPPTTGTVLSISH